MQTHSIALIGDCDPPVTAHRAIPLAIELASRKMDLSAKGITCCSDVWQNRDRRTISPGGSVSKAIRSKIGSRSYYKL
jgi:hypothetical protein